MSGIDMTVRKAGTDNKITIIKVAGSLDAHTVPAFEAKMNEILDSGNFVVLIDAEDINYISSAGLGVFMSILDTVEENNGDLSVMKVTEQFAKVFAMMKFDDLFSSYANEEEAVADIMSKIS